MGTMIFSKADAMASAVYVRCSALSDAGYYDAAAFYMRKILEIMATSFIDRYAELGMGQKFEAFASARGHAGHPTLDDKVDFLLAAGNLPEVSRKAYDDIRRYGNAAVHNTYFTENPDQHGKLLKRLRTELDAFHIMALQTVEG